jgi:diguanylate cyclase
VQIVLGCALMAFTVSTLPGVRGRPGFDVLLDGWLQCAGYVAAAALAVLRATASRVDRTLWAGLAVALCLRALGFVTFVTVVRGREPPPAPSVADAAWLATYVPLMVALVALARASFTGLSTSLLLDGVVGMLATSGIASAVVWPTVVHAMGSEATTAALVTDLAYPPLDVALLLAVVGVLLAFSWRPPPAVWALGAGIVGFAVTDGVFLYQSVQGEFRPGTALSALSLGATAVMAAAGWLPDERREGSPRQDLPGILVPACFALACLALVVYATAHPVPWFSVALATAGAAVAVGRTALSFHTLRAVAQHRREARTDELTGLPNRRAFNETLAAALRDRPDRDRLALLVLDVDDFKAVNDTLGHHVGDELLTLLAPRLQQVLRRGDLVARTGGDEFAVLLPDADAERAVEVATRLRAGLRRPFPLDSRPVETSASVGIAVFPDDGREAAPLLQRADLAMYDAKATRSGHSVFRPEHHRSSRARLESADRLRRAVDGELEVHYQPQVSLRTGAVVAVEALVRWRHPEDGLVGPAGFLPQVESAGLMSRLTGTVLEQAVRQCAAWRAQGTPVRVAVNLSVTDLLDVELPSQVERLLDRHGVPGAALDLELTEDLFMADPVRARTAIERLLRSGVRLQVDDYGTGYSSLGYLRDLSEISGLKLDRSFVTRLDVDPRSQAIVESTLGLARSLGLTVVAEGVESEPVRDRLAALGCELAQGLLFSGPVPAERLSFGVLSTARATPS